MVIDMYCPDRLKSGLPHRQIHITDNYGLFFYPFQDLRRKMEAGCRCGYSTLLPGKNCLVSFKVERPEIIVSFGALDVRRQRSVSDLFETAEDVSGGEAKNSFSRFFNIRDMPFKPGSEKYPVSPSYFFGRPAKDFPNAFLFFPQKEKFYILPFFFSPDLGGNDFGAVEDQDISLVEIIRKITEARMDDFPVPAPDHHHPRVVPFWKGLLGNEFGWKFVVEI
jgi:hypothetical protein